MEIEYKSKKVLIDEINLGLFNSYKWQLCKSRMKTEKYYLLASVNRKSIYLHRLLMNAGKGQIVDHINSNTLDNRVENLRIVDGTGNRLNSAVKSNKKFSNYKCVYKSGNKFQSIFNYKGKQHYCGVFDTELEAFNSYLEKRNKLLLSQASTII